MNRRQRRNFMKKFPWCKKFLKDATAASFQEFEKQLKEYWEKNGNEIKNEENTGDLKEKQVSPH